MVNPILEVWQENENGTFHKWPFFELGVQMKPAAALKDVCAEFGSLLLDKESAGRVLARLIDRGAKAGISVSVQTDDTPAALEGISDSHRLRSAITTLAQHKHGISSTTAAPAGPYSKSALRRLFGLS